ncbi:MAG: chemotaxis protein CheW [Planctomycetota bacterium]|nr:chemotaxis protein CheW [Planctomycetota bacterium]
MSDPDSVPTTAPASETSQYLTFALKDVTYALPVEAVKEIRGYTDVTPVPGAADYVLGVMNLRGQVIPVMDLRARFGIETKARDRFTVIVLIQLATRVVGAVVDAVADVLDIASDAIGPVPELGETIDQSYLAGMATIDDDVVLTLCVDAIVGSEGLADAASAA